jgi:malonate transporter
MGAALEPLRGTGALRVLAAAALGRLVIEPLLAIGLARLLGLDGIALGVVALCSAVPTSSTAYLLARALGGDAELTAAVTTVTTVLAIVTLPAVLSLVL